MVSQSLRFGTGSVDTDDRWSGLLATSRPIWDIIKSKGALGPIEYYRVLKRTRHGCATQMTNELARMLSKRTQIIWASFFVIISSMLVFLQIGGGDSHSGVLLTNISPMVDRPLEDPVFRSNSPIKQAQWSGIVVQHLGEPAGTIETIHRDHIESGLNGLGFHFVIGNGNGLGDGLVLASYRWIDQLPAARPISIRSKNWDRDFITICLVGNGNRRPFSERQLLHLSRLVQRLQHELSIAAGNVWLESDLDNFSDTLHSPGNYFAEALFRSQLLDIAAPF